MCLDEKGIAHLSENTGKAHEEQMPHNRHTNGQYNETDEEPICIVYPIDKPARGARAGAESAGRNFEEM